MTRIFVKNENDFILMHAVHIYMLMLELEGLVPKNSLVYPGSAILDPHEL